MDIPPPPAPGSPQQHGQPHGGPDPYGQPSPGGQQPSYGQPSPGGQPSYGQPTNDAPYGPAYGVGVPYQPWPHPYSPHAHPPVNGVAIASLVLGILCCLPGVGLILGVIALAQIKKKGERGTGLAVSGIVLSSLGLVLLVVALVTGGARGFLDGFRDGMRDAQRDDTTFSLAKGECFNAPGGTLEGLTYDVDRVTCSGWHDGEVFANFTLDDGTYPGDEEIEHTADDRCSALQGTYAMDNWAVSDDVDVYYFTPTRESWSLGDREITCLFGSTYAKGDLKGSLRQDAATLDDDQVAFLKAAHVVEKAMDTAPDGEYIEDDVTGHRKWASRVADALTEQADQLRAHDWPADSSRPVAALVRDVEAARKEWALAAMASDVDGFYDHYDKGMKLSGDARSVPARKALSLATAPPVDPEDSEGADGGGGGRDGGEAEV